MSPTSSKKPTRLKEMLDAWKPAKPKTVQQALVKNKSTLPLIKPTKDHKLLRFHEPFKKEQPLAEANAYDAKLAGTSLIVIDKSRTSAELKDIVEGFAKDCMDMSMDGHTVMGIAVAFD